jgi:hypothetical protein
MAFASPAEKISHFSYNMSYHSNRIIWKFFISLGRWFGRSRLAALLLASHFSFELLLFLLVCFGRLLAV